MHCAALLYWPICHVIAPPVRSSAADAWPCPPLLLALAGLDFPLTLHKCTTAAAARLTELADGAFALNVVCVTHPRAQYSCQDALKTTGKRKESTVSAASVGMTKHVGGVKLA